MNVSENKDSTQNQAVFEGIKETMLKEEVIPLEIIKYSDEIQEKRRLQDIFDNISTFTDTTAQTLESAIKKAGFCATLFKDKRTKEYIFAIRGTE